MKALKILKYFLFMPTLPFVTILAICFLIKELKNRDITDLEVNGINYKEANEFMKRHYNIVLKIIISIVGWFFIYRHLIAIFV